MNTGSAGTKPTQGRRLLVSSSICVSDWPCDNNIHNGCWGIWRESISAYHPAWMVWEVSCCDELCGFLKVAESAGDNAAYYGIAYSHCCSPLSANASQPAKPWKLPEPTKSQSKTGHEMRLCIIPQTPGSTPAPNAIFYMMNTTRVDGTHNIRDAMFDTCAMPGSVNSAAALIPLGLFLPHICLLLVSQNISNHSLNSGQPPAIETLSRASTSSVLHHIRTHSLSRTLFLSH